MAIFKKRTFWDFYIPFAKIAVSGAITRVYKIYSVYNRTYFAIPTGALSHFDINCGINAVDFVRIVAQECYM